MFVLYLRCEQLNPGLHFPQKELQRVVSADIHSTVLLPVHKMVRNFTRKSVIGKKYFSEDLAVDV